jgi:cellulose synthase (UDP-forming)
MISRRFRHSFWAAVYEISIAPYTAGVTLLAMVHPRYGRFHVTDKGVNIEQARFDLRTSWFTVLLLGLSLIGLVLALPLRLLYFSYYGADPAELDAILLNSAWALANLIILIAAASVGLEQPQQRRAPRVRREFACEIQTEDGVIACRTADMSETGARVVLPRPQAVPAECFLTFSDGEGARVRAQASRVRCDWNGAGKMEAAFDFRAVDADANRQLVELLFCRDDSWSRSGYPQDRVLRSFWHLLTTFWRATKPRRCEAALAPELRSRWRAGKWIEDLR